MKAWIKVCGITCIKDAEDAWHAGADAIGINLWPKSPRHVELAQAQIIADAMRGRVAVVTVSVGLHLAALHEVSRRVRPDWLQLHGDEPDEVVTALAPHAYRALGLQHQQDVARALAVPGPFVLVDARDEVLRGGTGRAPPQQLARAVCMARPTVLAGGLGPHNVAAAIAELQPAGVDAASGLESAPGRKDRTRVIEYVTEARRAFAALAQHPEVKHV